MADKDIARDGLQSFIGAEIKEAPVVTSGYVHVVPDSGFWSSLDMMIHYFTQVPKLDRREILVHLESMKKQGFEVVKGHIESVKTKSYGEPREGFLMSDTVYEKKWVFDGTGDQGFSSMGVLGQIEEAKERGEVKPYEPMTEEEFNNSLAQGYPNITYEGYIEEESAKCK